MLTSLPEILTLVDTSAVYRFSNILRKNKLKQSKLDYNSLYEISNEISSDIFKTETFINHANLLITMDPKNTDQRKFAQAMELSTPWEVSIIPFNETFIGYQKAQTRAPWIWRELGRKKIGKNVLAISNEPLVYHGLEQSMFEGDLVVFAFFGQFLHRKIRLLDSFKESDYENGSYSFSQSHVNFIDIEKNDLWMKVLFNSSNENQNTILG